MEMKRTRRIKGVEESKIVERSPKKTEMTPSKRADPKKAGKASKKRT